MGDQCSIVYNHMKTRGPISQKMAADLYGIQRLGARIWDLKKLGIDVRDHFVEGKNRFGVDTRWKEYFLPATPEAEEAGA